MKHFIFIHALFFHPLVMKPMENRFHKYFLSRREKIKTHQFGYPTRQYNFKTLLKLKSLVDSIDVDDEVYLIGHSLGGLVGRNYLDKYKPQRNISLITLGTPHNTSQVGTLIHRLHPNIIGTSSEAGIVSKIIPWSGNYPLYCISGTLAIGPLNFLPKLSICKEPNDGTVALSESYVDNCTDKFELPLTHTMLIYSKKTDAVIFNILKN